MAFVDFSDPEDMFDLLVDYVTDERSEAEDPARRRFLSGLLESLGELQDDVSLPPPQRIAALRSLHQSVDAQFEDDPVVRHLEDCAAELERLSERGS